MEKVLAIELLAACQGIEFHRPKMTTAPLEEVYKLVREQVRFVFTVMQLCVCVHVQVHEHFKSKLPPPPRPWDKDRYMAADIQAATSLLQSGRVWEVVEPYVSKYQAEIVHPPSPSGAVTKNL